MSYLYRNWYPAIVLIVAAFSFLIPTVGAQESAELGNVPQIYSEEHREKYWEVSVGAGTLVSPDYPGSDDYEFNYLPFVDIKYKNFFLSPKRGLGGYYKWNGVKVGASLNYGFGRDTDENARLSGLDEVDPSMQGEFYMNYWLKYLKLDATLARDLTEGYDGFKAQLSAGTGLPIKDTGLFVLGGVFTHIANSRHQLAYFGISRDEASRSIYNPHDVGTGFQDAGVHFGLRQDLGEGMALNARLTYTRLVGDAADSPIVQSENQWSGGAFLTYTFD